MVDKNKSLADMFKAFDFLSHLLLIGKLHSHGFSPNASQPIHSYLPNKKHRKKLMRAITNGKKSYQSYCKDLF